MALGSLFSWIGSNRQPAVETLPSASAPEPIAVNNNWADLKSKFSSLVWNPDFVTVEQYRKMIDSDEVVYYGLELLKTSIIRRLGEYTHSNPEIEAHVRMSFAGMRGTFWAAAMQMLSCLGYGYSVTEIVWKYSDGKLLLDSLQTLKPESVLFDISTDGADKNSVNLVCQRIGIEEKVLPSSKLIVYSHNAEGADPYGRSKLRSAYKSWFIKDEVLKNWAICSEKYGTPYTIGKSDANERVKKPGGLVVSALEYVGELLDSLSSKGSLSVSKGTDIEIVYPSRNFGEDFRIFIEYLNKSIFRALQIPSLLTDVGDTGGSYSLGQEHKRLFIQSVDFILFELIDVLLDQLVRKMIVYNFGEQDDYGDFSIASADPEAEKLLSEIAEKLINTGLADLSRLDDYNKLRAQFGLSMLSEDDVPSEMPDFTLPEQPDEPAAFSKVLSFAAKMKRRVVNFGSAA